MKMDMREMREGKAGLSGLQVNGRECPLAVETTRPVFSWRMECERTGARQEAYRIIVTRKKNAEESELLWDSGIVQSRQSVGVAYPEDAPELQALTDYCWKLQVWDEQNEELTAESCFATGLSVEEVPERKESEDADSLANWHDAKWIGPDEVHLAAYTLPVFRILYSMQILPGGTSAGIVFGANDPRYASSIQNNYLIHGENYIAVCMNISRQPAVIEVFRKGYIPGETGEEPLATIEIPESVICPENACEPHAFEIAVNGSQMETLTIDGVPIDIDQDNENAGLPVNPIMNRTHLILNPYNAILDVPVFPRLCEIGFAADEGTGAVFEQFSVRHYGGEQTEVFGEKTGAGYGIFEGLHGICQENGEHARLIVSPGTVLYADPSYGSAPMFRREFIVEKEPVSARIYAACRGIYDIRLNGEKVGDEYLAPGDMDFRQHIFYEAFDVTPMIQKGSNALGAVLGSGWYGDESSYTLNTFNFYGDRESFLGLLVLRYADGSEEYIGTDERWQYYGEGPVRYAANFNGETYDAVREAAVDGWDRGDFGQAASWKKPEIMTPAVCGYTPKILAKPDPGVQKTEERTACAYLGSQTRGTDRDTVYLYDMGLNLVGIPCITFPKGVRGRKITIRYAEMLYPVLDPENPYCYGELGGLILTENLRGALVTDRYVMKGADNEVFMPALTFHGYRYVEISGIDEALPAENVRAIVLSSVQRTAWYESSNPLTNQLFDNISRSTGGNFISIPTDCPQRDERLGWAGDAQIYSEAGTYMADAESFYRFFCLLQREAQGPDGTFHLYAPSLAPVGRAFAMGYTWNAAGVVIPWQTYRQYGDIGILRENYEAMRRHVLGMMEMKAEGRSYLTGHIGFLGDHLSLKDTDPSLMDNAQFYRVVRYTEEAARILGHEEDAETFAAFADGLRKEWNAVFVGPDHRTRSADGTVQDTQSSYALPLMCGIYSDENTPYAAEFLREACEKTGDTMTTGFMGTGSLLPALTEGGYADAAYRLFEQTAYPSWLYPVLNGATTVWERWSSYTIENGFGGQNGMNSFNHYSLGAVASWMLGYQAGIARGEEAGFGRFILQPTPGGHFTSLRAVYRSVHGDISSSWTAEDGLLRTYEAVVPANTEACLYLPVGKAEPVGSAGVKDSVCGTIEKVPEGAVYAGSCIRHGFPCEVYRLVSGHYRFTVTR